MTPVLLILAVSAVMGACASPLQPSPAGPQLSAPSATPPAALRSASVASTPQPLASALQPSPTSARAQGLATLVWVASGAPTHLAYAEGVAVDSAGNVFVTNTDAGQVQEYSSSGAFVREWGKPGPAADQLLMSCVDSCLPVCPPNPTGWDHCPHRPGGNLAIDGQGHVYVTDFGRVHVFDENGNVLGGWGKRGTGKGQLDLPAGIAVASNGDVYVADVALDRIVRYDRTGHFQLQWGSQGSGNGQFLLPYGVAIAPDGTVLVSDQTNNRIERFGPNGEFRASFTTPLSEPEAFFPQGIAVDSRGRVYAADPLANKVDIFNPNGSFVGTFGDPGQLSSASGVAVDPAGDIYVCDLVNSTVQKFAPTGLP